MDEFEGSGPGGAARDVLIDRICKYVSKYVA